MTPEEIQIGLALLGAVALLIVCGIIGRRWNKQDKI